MKSKNEIKDEIIEKLKEVYDPELPVNIWDLGLIYEININDNHVGIVMTLTAPNCPAAGILPFDVENKIKEIDYINDVSLQITWTPKWNKDMMSEEAKLELGFL